jgi:hypothetical protein
VYVELNKEKIKEEKIRLLLWWLRERGFRERPPGYEYCDRRFRDQMAILNFWR